MACEAWPGEAGGTGLQVTLDTPQSSHLIGRGRGRLGTRKLSVSAYDTGHINQLEGATCTRCRAGPSSQLERATGLERNPDTLLYRPIGVVGGACDSQRHRMQRRVSPHLCAGLRCRPQRAIGA